MNIRDKLAEIEARHKAISGNVYLPSGKSVYAYAMAAKELPATHADRADLLTIVKAALQAAEAAQKVVDGTAPCFVGKYEKCPHGRFGYEDCETCIDEYLVRELAAFREVAGND